MSRIPFAERRAEGVVLLRPESGEPLASSNGFDALLISRQDVEVHVLEVPRAAGDEPEGFLRYRIPSLYPGRPEASRFDYRILRLARRRFAVLFIAAGEVLEGYRAAAGGRPLLLPFSLFQPRLRSIARGGPRAGGRAGAPAPGARAALFSCWSRGWIDNLLVPAAGGDRPQPPGEEGPQAFVIRRGGTAAADLERLLARVGHPAGQVRWVILALEAERESLRELVRVAGGSAVEVRSIEEALAGLRRPDGLFEERRRGERLPRRIRVQLLILAILAAVFLLARKSADRETAYTRRLQGVLTSLEGQMSRAVPRQQEAERLEGELRALQAHRPVDPFRVLAGLETLLREGVRIRSFQLEKSSFQIEAVAANPLRLMEAFARSEAFTEVRMIQVIPLKEAEGELFRLTGRIRDGGPDDAGAAK